MTQDCYTPAEIAEITRLKNPAAQEALLREWGLNVRRNRRNEVVLAKEAFIRWQLGEKISQQTEPRLKLRSAA